MNEDYETRYFANSKEVNTCLICTSIKLCYICSQWLLMVCQTSNDSFDDNSGNLRCLVRLCYQRILKVMVSVTFGFSSPKWLLLLGSRYFRMVKKR